jgi:ABC-type cobalamin transport system ATPase subunit
VLHGREVERARLIALIEAARGGTAGALVVHGEPGVGKSALLADVVSATSGVRVLRTQGLESESPLAFAALHRLLRPVLALIDRLPAPQAQALRVASRTRTSQPNAGCRPERSRFTCEMCSRRPESLPEASSPTCR